MSKVYKVLNVDGSCCHCVFSRWNAPANGQVGKWMPKIEKLMLSQSGYHLCCKEDLVTWLGPAIWEAETRGKQILDRGILLAEQARLLRKLKTWNADSARLFAYDCAIHFCNYLETDLKINDLTLANHRYFQRKAQKAKSVVEKLCAQAATFALSPITARNPASTNKQEIASFAAYNTSRFVRGIMGFQENQWQTKRLFEYLEES